MGRPLLSPLALTSSQVRRVSGCGRPVTYLRESGEWCRGNFICGCRYCSFCSSRQASRAFAKIMEALEKTGQEEVFMLTITRRFTPRGRKFERGPNCNDGMIYIDWGTPEQSKLNEIKRLEDDIARGAAQWKHATKRTGWDDYRLRSGLPPGERAIRPVKICAGEKDSLSFRSEYLGGGRWSGHSKTTYLWAREITTGRSGQDWHVHRHVLCPDLVTAQRLANAAASYRDDLQGDSPYVMDIRKWDREQCAGYLAGYLSGTEAKSGGFVGVMQSLTIEQQFAWRIATAGMRRYDAGGRWRPLGMTRPQSDDPVVAVGTVEGILVDAQTFFERGASISPLRVTFCSSTSMIPKNSINSTTWGRRCVEPLTSPCGCSHQNLCKPPQNEACETIGVLSYWESKLIPPDVSAGLKSSGERFQIFAKIEV